MSSSDGGGPGDRSASAFQALRARLATLCSERFAPRADQLDRDAAFPSEDFVDLHAAGLLGATIPESHGGLGLGPLFGRSWDLWQLTALIAEADLSLGRCWEGHTNALAMIHGMGSDEQRRRWFAEVQAEGTIWVGWSGEPQRRKPGEQRFGTELRRAPGGWVVNGSKVFATSAGGAHRAILFVSPDGPGGVRHAEGNPNTILMLAASLQDPSVEVDPSWWDPIGMRATVSHLVRFHDTFVPDEDIIGRPGQYLSEQWQTYFVPHYAASFLGAMQAALKSTLRYVHSADRVSDPYVQQRVGRMQTHTETVQLWLEHVGRLFDQGQTAEARLAGTRARFVAETLGAELLQDGVHATGARSLIRPGNFERIFRDLTFYFRHDNLDHLLATSGRAALGEAFDPAFHKP